MKSFRERVNWQRLAVTVVSVVVGTLVGYSMLTGLLAITLFGGWARTWAGMIWLDCQAIHVTAEQCAANGPMHVGFMIGMGIILSIASIPFIMFTRGWLEEK